MRSDEVSRIAEALGVAVVSTATLAGGFSHETCLLDTGDGLVVVRLGGQDQAVEGAVMAKAREHVPVPRVLRMVPAVGERARSAMVLEYVAGTALSEVLAGAHGDADMGELGAQVGRTVAGIGAISFARPGFFGDEKLTVREMPPWSRQLAEFAATCMAATPDRRLDPPTRRAWIRLCTTHAPALAGVDHHSRLVHADMNPKNVLVSRTRAGWRVDAVLDWEFSYSGCPFGDAGNMVRFGDAYPGRYVDGFRTAFAEHHPADLVPNEDWSYLGHVLDMFAMSDLVTRPPGHPVADEAAQQIMRWVAEGVPRR
jgi:aminoglycoside phosphotransferase (APT) family kinase protein